MKQILCVSPYYLPFNTPDMQRLRMLTPLMGQHGWQPTLLTVAPHHHPIPPDPTAEPLGNIPIHACAALPYRVTRYLGLGNLGLRCWPYLLLAGLKLLRQQPFDLVYFSTTQFDAISVGPLWKRLTGVPFVVDLQDPWRNDFHLTRPRHERPAKFWFDYPLKKLTEGLTMPHASGMTAVTANYLHTMQQRYPTLHDCPALELPFGGSLADFARARHQAPHPFFDPAKTGFRVVMTGAIPTHMQWGMARFLRATKKLDQAGLLPEGFHIYLIGTNYAQGPTDQPPIQAMAHALGIGHRLTEQPQRIGFLQTLNLMQQADLLLLPGQREPNYTPSKIYQYALSGTPTLAWFHEQSHLCHMFETLHAGTLHTFNHATLEQTLEIQLQESLLAWINRTTGWKGYHAETVQQFEATALAKKLCRWFDEIIATNGP
ncbi:hypothetical protein [Magnetococcus marinus]|nr:hypothetical protein [Magnetococcus marinus]